MKIMKVDYKIEPKIDEEKGTITICLCTVEAYKDIKETFKNGWDKDRKFEGYYHVDLEGNWNVTLSMEVVRNENTPS